MRAVRLLPLLLLLVFAAACGDSPSQPRTPSIDGAWSGSAAGFTLNLVLASGAAGVSGNGTVSGEGTSIAVTATGTHVHPNVALTLQATGFQDLNFQGQFTDDNTINGTLNGSGFNNFALTLRRQ